MTPSAACPTPTLDVLPVAPHDYVRVPDGRVGEVIGFYRTADEAVLVRFAAGQSERYGRAHLSRA
jgi:hypothetical protein